MSQSGTELAINSATDHTGDLLYQSCAQQGIRYAMSILRNQSDAEEAVQEAFCRLHRRHSPDDESAYRGKFFVTLRNHCIDLVRRRNVRKEVRMVCEVENQQKSKVESKEIVALVEEAMLRLPENWRQALRLKIHGELSYQEIADITGSTFGQVRTWIYRARRQLASELNQIGIVNPSQKKQ